MGSSTEIVVGVDGSPDANAAVRWAATRAKHTGESLHLLHVYPVSLPSPALLPGGVAPFIVDPETYLRVGEAIVAEAAERARGHAEGVRVRTELRVGSAAQALIDAAPADGLVVVGSRGLGGFSGLLLGSVGVQVSGHARCPTVVVRGDASATGPVVVGVDGSDASDLALGFAFAEAQRLGTAVRAVHAWATPLPTSPAEAVALASVPEGGPDFHLRTARQLLSEALAPHRHRFPDVPVEEQLPEAAAAPALIKAADGAAMIVVGSRGRGGFSGLLLGSASQALLHHAGCPVVVTRVGQAVPAAA